MKKNSDIFFITWLRACSAVFILLCHYCSRCSHPFVPMLTMVFNIGVQLFFIMSGFLVGFKGIKKPYTEWYKKRIRRIYVPFWLFLLVLAFVHIANNRSVLSVHWLLLALGLQGTVVHMGCGADMVHLCFAAVLFAVALDPCLDPESVLLF